MVGNLRNSAVVTAIIVALTASITSGQTYETPYIIIVNEDGKTTEEIPEPIIQNDARNGSVSSGGVSVIVTDDQNIPSQDLPQPVHQEKDFEMFNPTHVHGEKLYESDILLTLEQKAALAERKAIISSLNYRWQEAGNGFPFVPYVFADNDVDQTAVLAGISHWEDHTCINFGQTTDTNQPHLKFIKGSGCYSFIGRIWTYLGQDVSIGEGCTSLGTVVHEIGHAMGFYHEQSRPDRDSYVVINTGNIQSGKESNFDKASDTSASNYSVPYDYSSDMHYGGTYFSKNGHLTIATINPLAQELIGSRSGLSHRDKLLANRMYNCTGKWLDACGLTSDPCLNDGYMGENCQCVCPSGTSGTNCDTVTADYYDSLLSGCSEKITSPKTISSPGYPSNYDAGLQCVKWIVAPACQKVQLTVNSFRLYNQITCNDGSQCCYWDGFEIRTSNLFDGAWYCGQMITAGTSFTSTTNEMIIFFTTRTNFYSGFTADITFISDPLCTTTTTSTSSTTTTSTTTPSTTTTTTPTTTTTTPTTTTTTTSTTTPTTTTTTPTTTTTTTSTTTPTTTTTTPTTTTTTTSTTTPTTTTTTTSTTSTSTSTSTTSTTTTTSPSQAKCQVVVWNSVFYWTSPNFGTLDYPNNKYCGLGGASGSPRWSFFKFESFQLQSKVDQTCADYVSFQYPYGVTKKFCGDQTGRRLKIPTFYYGASFRTDSSITNTGFNISLEARPSPCHLRIDLTELGETGVFKTPRYPRKDRVRNRMCEIWITAPDAYHVRLDFLGFKLKWPCIWNSLVVNLQNQHHYPKETSSRYCGTKLPPTMTSNANEAYLVYMTNKKSNGFKFRYTVVP